MDQVAALTLPGSAIRKAFDEVRERTDGYCAHLSPEDQQIQSMADASPAKWHRAHTTWFFERFVLRARVSNHTPFEDDYNYLFNSYYETLGERHPRAVRGLVTRPTSDDVSAYRVHVDDAIRSLLADPDPELVSLMRLGIAHEEQHQELLLTDVMHAFAQNPLVWRRRAMAVVPGWIEPTQPEDARMITHEGGLAEAGADVRHDGFTFDNEGPHHRILLQPHAIAAALVRNRDWEEFIADGGYRRADLWMADGWDCVRREGWCAPLYWRDELQLGLGGAAPRDPAAPVRHVSWYEADAYARWAGGRLPTEFELEASAGRIPGLHGHVWQWTASPYVAYPGFKAAAGAVGEYNGKFMVNQMVLRGSSHATSPGHSRTSYRNFFQPEKRWQVTGLRLAQDL
jgi:ergothioneine biosynthesis protein EgtB